MTRNVHKIAGWIMLVIGIAWTGFLTYGIMAFAMMFFFASIQGYGEACAPLGSLILSLPLVAVGTIGGALFVLLSRYKIAGYILFVAAFLLPRFLPIGLGSMLCSTFIK